MPAKTRGHSKKNANRKNKVVASNKSKIVAEILQHKKELLLPSATIVATAAFKAAKEACEAKVDAIVAECIENNTKFRDLKFDLLHDQEGCLLKTTLTETVHRYIAGVKRVPDLIRNPVFFLNGASPDDIMQGRGGDCWFMAALSVVSNIPGLLEHLCVKRNEEVGVYGFIFFKDGDWISTVVDDQLFYELDQSYKSSLYFSKCRSENETWLPLMEKAYAKIHGDYDSIDGGLTAEGIEDLTGGVSSMIYTVDILNKDRFWEEDMKQVNKTLLIGCCITRVGIETITEKRGIIGGHAYSVLRVGEYQGERLVQVRNPWGKTEWNGDWSDECDKWTPEAKKALDYKDLNDGQFWMSYKDFLRTFVLIDRCKIFDATWSVASSWIPYHIEPRSSGKYELEIKNGSESVIVLSQPDKNYYGALIQKYHHKLFFHVYDKDGKLVKRSKPSPPLFTRSVNCEVSLKAGKYTIIPYVIREVLDVDIPTKGEGKDDDNKDDDDKSNSVVPSGATTTNYTVEEEAVTLTKADYMFEQRKVESARARSIARLKGQTLLGVDDDDFAEAADVGEEEKWQITIGLRVYTHDFDAVLQGVPGEHPVKADPEKTEEVKAPEDPEAVTSTLADKKTGAAADKKVDGETEKEE
ncbi:hypothetical protein EDD11_002848 [Mortierella claussenii]|nr:hypothetical protein EDD11_002848 [Mortierella claussenii]